MAKKTWISVKRGIIDPKHQATIGPAVWLFLYLLDNCNWADGKVYGYTDGQAAEDLGMEKRTVRDHRTKLQAAKYISCQQRKHDQTITIHNWTNPREYSGKTRNPPDMAVTPERHPSEDDIPMSPGDDIKGDTKGDTKGDNGMSPVLKESSSKIKDHKSNERIKERPPSSVKSVARHRERTLDALNASLVSLANGDPDYSKFLPGVVPVIRKLHELWRLPLPTRIGVCREWSEEAFRVIEAADGLDVEMILDKVFVEWDREREYNQQRGKPVFWIQRPNMVIGLVRAKVGSIRQQKEKYRSGKFNDFWDG